MWKKLYKVLLYLLIISSLISTYLLLKYLIENEQAKEDKATIVFIQKKYKTENIIVNETKEEVKMHINIEALQQEVNKDIIGWINVDGTNIDEPILQHSNENKYYLKRDIYHKWSVLGSIFLDIESTPDFSNTISYIFGHNTHNDTKFTQLENFYKEDFYNKNKEFHITLENKTIDYEIIGAIITPQDISLYTYKQFTPEHIDYIKEEMMKLGVSGHETSKLTEDDKLVFLITCKRFDNPEFRRIIIGKLKKETIY